MGEVVTGGPLSPAAVGAEIAQLRAKSGWTIEQLASELKIAPRQLMLLEQGAWERLPSPLFVRGVLKRVADWGGCSPQAWLAAVDGVFSAPSFRLTPPSNAEGEIVGHLPFWQRRSAQLILLLVAAVLLAVAYLNWFGVIDPFGRQERTMPSAAVVVPHEEPDEGRALAPIPALAGQGGVAGGQAPDTGADQEMAKAAAAGGGELPSKSNTSPGLAVSEEGSLPASQPIAASAPMAEKGRAPSASAPDSGLVVRAKGGESWLRVTAADGRVRYEGILRDGNERQFPAEGAPYALHIGNAQALILSWQGEAVTLPGKGTARLQVPAQKGEKAERRDE